MDRLLGEFEKFQTKVKQAQTQFANVGDMQSELSALEARVESTDGSVTVVAGPNGAVKSLSLTPDAMRQQPQQLASAIVATLQQAVAEVARKQAGIVDTHLGGAFGIDLTNQVMEAQAEAMGTTVADLQSKLPGEPASPQRTRDDDEPPAAPPRTGGASDGDQFLRNLFDDEEDHR